MKIYKNGDNSLKLTKHQSTLNKIFYQCFKVSSYEIRSEGNKLRNI